MNKRKKKGYKAGKRVQGLWTIYPDELNGVAELAEEKVFLDETLNGIEIAASIQSNDTTGDAENKQEKKQLMAKTILKYALRGRVKANKIGNTKLEAELNHPISYFLFQESEIALARCTAIKNKIKENLGILTNISADNVTEMEKSIALFETTITIPQQSQTTKTVAGTEELNQLSAKLDQTIDNIGDLIHSYFPDSNISEEFDLRSKLGEGTTRHNHLIIHVEESGSKAPIATAKGIIDENGKAIPADSEGQIILNTIRAGKHKVTIQAPGYVTQTVPIYVHRSTTTEIEVELEKE